MKYTYSHTPAVYILCIWSVSNPIVGFYWLHITHFFQHSAAHFNWIALLPVQAVTLLANKIVRTAVRTTVPPALTATANIGLTFNLHSPRNQF